MKDTNPIVRAAALGLTVTRDLADRGLSMVDPDVSRELSERGLSPIVDGEPASDPEPDPDPEPAPDAEPDPMYAGNHLETQLGVARALAESASVDEAIDGVLLAIGGGLGWPEGGCWIAEDDDPPADALPPTENAVAVPLVTDGTTLGVMEFLVPEGSPPDRDLDETMAAIGAQVAQFIGRKRAEAEVEQLKDEFFGLVSHELRTPLTSIVGYTEMLSKVDGERLSDRGHGFIDVIRRNARREMRLVGDLLVLVRIQAGTFQIEPGTVDLCRVVEEAIETARPAAEKAKLELTLKDERVKPCAGDAERLAQAVDNLLSNAIKFTPEGGRVEVTLSSENETAVIEVADTGVGIPEADHERLFDRLYRASSATEGHVPGTGLGLTIVRAIVEAHGGTVSVDSREHHGSTFRIELPVRLLGSQDDQHETGCSSASPAEHPRVTVPRAAEAVEQ